MGAVTPTGKRYPVISDSADVPRDVLAALTDVDPNLVQRFATTTERDTAVGLVAFKECYVGETKYIRFGTTWIVDRMNVKTRGPASVVDYAGPLVVCQISVPVVLGRTYRITGTIKAQQITSAGKPSVYVSSSLTSAGRETSIIDGHATYAIGDVCSSGAPVLWTGATGAQTFSIIASTSAGALRMGANSAALWAEDIGQ